MKIKKGDEVKVVAGKDKGKTGKVEKVFPKEQVLLVAGVNQYKRHLKARSASAPSQIVTITKPLPIANVSFVCPKCHKQARVGYANADGKKRICKKCKEAV